MACVGRSQILVFKRSVGGRQKRLICGVNDSEGQWEKVKVVSKGIIEKRDWGKASKDRKLMIKKI